MLPRDAISAQGRRLRPARAAGGCWVPLGRMVSAAVAALAGVALSGAVAPAFAAQWPGGDGICPPHPRGHPRQSPAPAVMTPMRWAHVAGFLHTCAITTGSTLWCWA
jgi:hypothetical protein